MKTIAAISTAPINAAIGLVRLSGDDAESIAQSVFTGTLRERMAVYGRVTATDGATLDICLATLFKGPHSYTGEDVVEFSCHGGMIVLQNVLARLCEAGAVLADRGEYTKRAFLNGKMDLTQSEAVIDIITAKSPLSAKEAFLQAEGSLRHRITALRNSLLDIDSEIMVYADFAAEGIEAPDGTAIATKLEPVISDISRLCNSYSTGKILKDGYPVAVCGKPNVGKSSIMNMLLKSERSIVTDIEGTTRDIVSESAVIDGVCILLNDTAGIRESGDVVEKIGIERAKKAMAESETAICVFDGSKPLSKEDDEIISLSLGKKSICVINKSDLGLCITPPKGFEKTVYISAKNGDGFEKLCAAIKENALSGAPMENGEMITNIRHKQALDVAKASLEKAKAALLSGIDPEIAEFDISEALNSLGLITGDNVTDDLIDRIYANFCVGK